VDVVLVVAGVALVVLALADLVNTLVTTSTSYARLWPTRLVWSSLYAMVRGVAARLPTTSSLRERLLATFGPLLLVALLTMWAAMQVAGFALVWLAVTGVETLTGFGDALYYSGVVYFTVGFGEIVPAEAVPRAGALVEAFAGVTTTALVIGYLPSLYNAYSEREQPLMILDDGSGNRITPLSLVLAWSPDANPAKLEARFAEWERWVAAVHETHSTLPLLRLFRSHDPRQHWVTALGVVTDAALISQQILGAYDGHGYWLVRRSTALFDEMARFAGDDAIEPYRRAREDQVRASSGETFDRLHDQLVEHGFRLVPKEIAMEHGRQLRAGYAPQMEFLIDYLLAPRGFWSPGGIDVPLLSTTHPEMLHYEPDETEPTT
jgi:hypothetical protein